MARAVVDREFERRLAALVNSREPRVLSGGRRGVERETLRVTPAGRVSQRPHPAAIGSALCSAHVTTDYSEALAELVTPTFTDVASLHAYLAELHLFVARNIDDELLWAASMPCAIAGEAELPIARYGSSHQGRFKEIYRRGLQLRYGGLMQAIAGAHYNYSFPDGFWPVWAEVRQQRQADAAFLSKGYFELLRNYRRHGWLTLYLFGYSPAVLEGFVAGRAAGVLEPLGPGTLHGPYATSLRMSDLGYRNPDQSAVQVSANSLEAYLADLNHATHTLHPPYAALGVQVDGDYRQLNANLLQIENEYYSGIRPKRAPRAGEGTARALARGGVEYVEFRALDICATEPTGVCPDEMHFMEAFAALCLMRSSDLLSGTEQSACERNQLLVARRGREPGLALERDGRSVALATWAAELLDQLEGICERLDAGQPGAPYAASLQRQRDKLRDPALTPSARMLRALADAGGDYQRYVLELSSAHRAKLLAGVGSDAAVQRRLAEEAQESLRAQEALERGGSGSFEEYIARVTAPLGAG